MGWGVLDEGYYVDTVSKHGNASVIMEYVRGDREK